MSLPGDGETEYIHVRKVLSYGLCKTNNDVIFCLYFSSSQIPSRGSLALVVVMTFLQGLCGMSYGLCISALVDDEMSAIQFALGSFYPVLLLSGKFSADE